MNEDNELPRKVKLHVESEIHDYVYDHPESAIGQPWGDDRVQASLEEMRNALVEPYWADVLMPDRWDNMRVETSEKRRCVVVADNRKGYLVLWDPEQNIFILGHTTGGPLASWGLTGDAVGCFLSI
jgi:hypothetical protein